MSVHATMKFGSEFECYANTFRRSGAPSRRRHTPAQNGLAHHHHRTTAVTPLRVASRLCMGLFDNVVAEEMGDVLECQKQLDELWRCPEEDIGEA